MNTNAQEIVESRDILPRRSLDSLFKEYYIETASISESYRRACKAGGHDYNDKYVAQYGKAMFDRLASEIARDIEKADTEDEALGRMVQRDIAINGESESSRLQAATALRKKKVERLEISKPQSMEDIDAELEAIERTMKENAIDGECSVVDDTQQATD